MKKLFSSNFLTVVLLFLAAAIVSVIAYPEIFLTFKTSFILWNDYDVEYEPTFVLTNFLYQGGLQLWDYFGQMPYFHSYATLGLFKFPNVVTAVTYYLLEPFSSNASALFHHVFAWAYVMTILAIRMTGIFLLLKMVTKNRVILTVGTVVFAVFFCPLAFVGGAFYRNYYPLGVYFVVRFFRDLELRYLAAAFLFLMVVLGTELLHGGYFYLPIHFLIISGILWRSFFYKPRFGKFWQAWDWRQAAWIALAAVLILLPYAYIVKFGFKDLAFGQADSRISHPFNPEWYFHNPNVELGTPGKFFSSILNMQTYDTFYYLGITFLFLAMVGLVFGQNRLKYLFGATVLFLWLLTFPREGFNIGLIAHWLNALTNPLKTIPRSLWLASGSILPFLLMPLAVMGIEALMELYRGKKYKPGPWGLVVFMLLALVINGLPVLPPEVRTYLLAFTFLVIASIVWVYQAGSAASRNVLAGWLALFAVLDIFLIVHQTKKFTFLVERRPRVLDAAPQSGMIEYDDENPSIFPYRYTYTLDFSYRDESYIWFPHAVSSDMHHVINQGLNYVYLNGYNPRHKEFAGWPADPSMGAYLSHNDEWIFLARSAVNAAPGVLSRIVAAGMSREVVAVDDPRHVLNLPDRWPANTPKSEDDFQYAQALASLDDDQDSNYRLRGDMIVYTWDLPKDFPEHVASSWFMPEQRYLRFLVETSSGQWKDLQETQGELIRPYTFDVQNIKKGELKAAFPKDDFPFRHRCALLYPSPQNQGVVGLWRRQFDNLGLIYRAKHDGWLVGHYPYDPKFRIYIDGKPVKYWRVNKSFIGFPLSAGEHRILVQYWPHSPLRPMLFISGLLTTIGLLALIFVALKWEV